MPCRSDYLEPNHREQLLQEIAQLLIYVRKNTKTGVKVDGKLRRAANDIYCTKDYVPELCATLRALPSEDFERVVYNAREPMSRKLADWWEEHEAADQKRIEAEAQKMREEAIRVQAIAKLTNEEKRILGI
jgi:hypothetical protein